MRIGRWKTKTTGVRDATAGVKTAACTANPTARKPLALLRGAILALIPQEKFTSLNAAFDHYPENRVEALRLLTQTAPQFP